MLSRPALLSAFAGSQFSQTPQTPILHADTRVVQIEVAVKDSHGHPVRGLSTKDFVLTDQVKPRNRYLQR
jgi:hypothetical protein